MLLIRNKLLELELEGGDLHFANGARAIVKRAMSASSLLVLVLWSAALLSERSWLLAVVDAKANSQLPDCTATADWGRCDRIHDGEGCPQVREVSRLSRGHSTIKKEKNPAMQVKVIK